MNVILLDVCLNNGRLEVEMIDECDRIPRTDRGDIVTNIIQEGSIFDLGPFVVRPVVWIDSFFFPIDM